MKSRAFLNGSLLVVVAVASAALGGCAAPGVMAKPATAQYSLSDVRDWDAAALRLVQSLETEGFIPSTPAIGAMSMHPERKPYAPPYYINIMVPGSSFLAEVRQRMEFEFLRRNFAVVDSPIGATVINLDAEMVHWATSVYPDGSIPNPRTELLWRASIMAGSRETVLSRETDWISQGDAPLYFGETSLPALATPGVAALGSPVPLRYAR